MGAISGQFKANPEYATYMTAAFATMLIGGFSMVYFKPKRAPLFAAIVMVIGASALIGEFERVREFVRKPYIIYGYMYANGVREADIPFMKKEGYLKHATFVPPQFRKITDENKEVVGQYLFKMECRFCHTVNGINGIKARIEKLGIQGNEEAIYARLGSLNSPATPYMPPFAGNDEERHALAAYLKTLHEPASEGVTADFRGAEEVRR
jgi:mono/diheme cytochrome c family protein